MRTRVDQDVRGALCPLRPPVRDEEGLMNQIPTEGRFLFVSVGSWQDEILPWIYRVFPVFFPSFSREAELGLGEKYHDDQFSPTRNKQGFKLLLSEI
ncbi:MAG: hypothetical protein OEZ36_08750 [Spirochaetota bacterium]|nr:hypothetical protein [Spirochaetota bacterium]